MAAALAWNLVCRVVDNYGDAGVAWRLARQLADEHRQKVTLWIDDLASLARLVPALSADATAGRAEGVEVRALASAPAAVPTAADVVVEAFGCGLPPGWIEAIARRRRPPVWIVLEYLSAEPWVDTANRRASPHPATAVPRWYWCPGFTPASGGLLREHDAIARMAAVRADPRRRSRTLAALGASAPPGARVVLAFVYPGMTLAPLLDAWSDATAPTIALVPQGVAVEAIDAWSGGRVPRPGTSHSRGALTVSSFAFVPQRAFDDVLASSDFAFVRGEDSFVRAQWAGVPFAWQAYRQDAGAQRVKVDAFLERYLAEPGPGRGPAEALRAVSDALNRDDGAALVRAWPGVEAGLPDLADHGRRWSAHLGAQSDLATGLVEFVASKL
ncbi:MAG: elongation factor P maturation arginine rhamnosyltransferase EarP [Burkholderiales bacterium]